MAENADTYMDVGVRATQDAKAEFTGVNEHFEAIFNAAEATQIVFQQPASPTQSLPISAAGTDSTAGYFQGENERYRPTISDWVGASHESEPQ